MGLHRVISLFKKSSVGKLPRKLLYLSATSSDGGLEEKRFFRTMPVNYIAQYLDDRTYPVLPSNLQDYTFSSNYFRKEEITPDMLLSKEKKDEFMSYFPDIVKQLEAKTATLYEMDSGRHIKKILEYYIPGGSKFGGIVVAETYRMLLPKSQQTPENIKLGYYLGWCVELFYDFFFMTDDIMDEGEKRRNRTSWHLLEDVKMGAIADAVLIEAGMYYLLRKNFGHLDCFMRLLEFFCDISIMFSVGQRAEMSKDFNPFQTSPRKLYEATLSSAGVYFAGYLPVAAGATLAGYTDPEVLRKAKSILSQLGYFYLIENDYMDCFVDTEITGRVPKDIRTGRCRWPIVAFLEVATPEQKRLMKAHYGHDSDESEAIAKQLFMEANIPQIYAEYTAELYHRLMKDIEENSYGDLEKVYRKLVESIPYSLQAGGSFL